MVPEDELSAIEAEFSQSWDWMERYFTNLSEMERWEGLAAMLGLIAEMRKQGYDRQLRAGQSLWWLMLSRSRKHGLRDGQHFIRIHAAEGVAMTVTFVQPPNPKIELVQPEIKLTAEVDDLLQRLLEQPID